MPPVGVSVSLSQIKVVEVEYSASDVIAITSPRTPNNTTKMTINRMFCSRMRERSKSEASAGLLWSFNDDKSGVNN